MYTESCHIVERNQITVSR